MKNNTFNTLLSAYIEDLRLYVPIVKRVHGPTHPEFYEVAKYFEILVNKLNSSPLDLSDEFTNLRTVTNNYTIPSDVCETYEAVYNMLAKLDAAYKEE